MTITVRNALNNLYNIPPLELNIHRDCVTGASQRHVKM